MGTIKSCFPVYKYSLLPVFLQQEGAWTPSPPCRQEGVWWWLHQSLQHPRKGESQPLNQVWAPKPPQIPQPKTTLRKRPLLPQETSSEEAAKGKFIKSCCCKTQFLTCSSWKERGGLLWKASLHAPLSFPIKIPHAGLFIPSAHSSQIVCPSDRWKIHSVLEGV